MLTFFTLWEYKHTMQCVRFLSFLCLIQKYSLSLIVHEIFFLFSYLVQWDNAMVLTGLHQSVNGEQCLLRNPKLSPVLLLLSSLASDPQDIACLLLLSEIVCHHQSTLSSGVHPKAQIHHRTKNSHLSSLFCLYRQVQECFPSELLLC